MNSFISEGEFELFKANTKEFAINFSIYRENVWFRQSWERRLTIFDDDDACFWITCRRKRIGGVCVTSNTLSALFVIPPYSDIYYVVSLLKKHLIQISNLNEPIKAYGIMPYQSKHFLRLGFLPCETRRVMIRPTEQLELEGLGDQFTMNTPNSEHIDIIAQMCFESYSGVDNIGYHSVNTIEQQKSDLEDYFIQYNTEILKQASSVIFDKSNNNIVAICLISLWEDLPLVSNVAVLPMYRGNQIAKRLINKAVNVLNREYDVIRLFVTIGNSAESLYYNLGFHPGMEQTTFHLPPRINC